MALVKGPLLSIAASGQISRTMTFRAKRKLKTVSKFAVPSQPSSVSQQAQNLAFGKALDRWRDPQMECDMRSAYRRKAKQLGINLPPYQLFISQFSNLDPLALNPIAYRCLLQNKDPVWRIRFLMFDENGNPDWPVGPAVKIYVGPALHGPWECKQVTVSGIGRVNFEFPIDTPFPFYAYCTTGNDEWCSGVCRWLSPPV